jgi:hypothetical protein
MSGQDLMESGRALSSSSERSFYIVWTRATSLLLSEAASARTSSIHRPDGDPTKAINSPARRILTIPTQSHFWLFVSSLFVSFWLFAFFSYSRYCFSALISSVFFLKTVRMLFIFGI